MFQLVPDGLDLKPRCLQADPVIEISDLILKQSNPEFLSVGDGIVTFHCANGDVSYGLVEHDDYRQTWLGVRPGYEVDE